MKIIQNILSYKWGYISYYCRYSSLLCLRNSSVEERQMSSTDDNSPIDAITAPEDDVSIPYLAHEEADFSKYGGKYDIHHFYIRCSDIATENPIQFPLDANPRHPRENTQVAAMRDTLQENPKDFVNRNNGIVVLASEVNPETVDESEPAEGQAIFEYGEGEGVCNGGHTLLAIQEYGEDPTAVVHIEVIELGDVEAKSTSRRKEISDIADARNNNNQLQERSEANFLGYYDQYKNHLKERTVVDWHEGDPNAIGDALNAYQFFRLLKSLDIDDFGHPIYDDRGKNHQSLATSVSAVHRRWKESMDEWKQADGDPKNRPLRHLTPLANDVIYIREMVSHNLMHFDYDEGLRRKGVFQKYFKSNPRRLFLYEFDHSEGYDLPNPVEVLFTGLFRTNLYLSESDTGSAELIGWFRNPQELWANRSAAILNEMNGDFKDNDKDPKDFIRANAPFTHDFYLHGMSNKVEESPVVVYEIYNGGGKEASNRYVRVHDQDEATHELILKEAPEEPDRLVKKEGSIDSVPMKEMSYLDAYDYDLPE